MPLTVVERNERMRALRVSLAERVESTLDTLAQEASAWLIRLAPRESGLLQSNVGRVVRESGTDSILYGVGVLEDLGWPLEAAPRGTIKAFIEGWRSEHAEEIRQRNEERARFKEERARERKRIGAERAVAREQARLAKAQRARELGKKAHREAVRRRAPERRKAFIAREYERLSKAPSRQYEAEKRWRKKASIVKYEYAARIRIARAEKYAARGAVQEEYYWLRGAIYASKVLKMTGTEYYKFFYDYKARRAARLTKLLTGSSRNIEILGQRVRERDVSRLLQLHRQYVKVQQGATELKFSPMPIYRRGK